MPQADRAFASFARRPAIRAATLLWLWLTMVMAPVGATLHAMSHLRLPANAEATAVSTVHGVQTARQGGRTEDPASSAGITVGVADAASPQAHRHGAMAHCHVCDEWQFLDHVLPAAALIHTAASPATPLRAAPPATRVFAETPWILPRAPPAH